jgi:hypothetical protein
MSGSFDTLPREQPSIGRALLVRRIWMLLFAAVALAALLNLFGQQPTDSVASSSAARVTLSAPETVRGGLLFQARLEVRAVRRIEAPRLVLDEGWFEGLQFNSMTPQATSESPRDGQVVFSYDTLEAGDLLRIWVQFEANPSQGGRRSFAVELDDATEPVARIDRHITVLL